MNQVVSAEFELRIAQQSRDDSVSIYILTYVYKDFRQMISTEVYVGHRAFKTKIMGSNIFWIEKDNKYEKTQELVKSKKRYSRFDLIIDCFLPASKVITRCYGDAVHSSRKSWAVISFG